MQCAMANGQWTADCGQWTVAGTSPGGLSAVPATGRQEPIRFGAAISHAVPFWLSGKGRVAISGKGLRKGVTGGNGDAEGRVQLPQQPVENAIGHLQQQRRPLK